MFYNNFDFDINEPFIYNRDEGCEMESISFKDQVVFGGIQYNSKSFSINSKEFEELYYVKPSTKIELEEEDLFLKEKGKENVINAIERTKTTEYKTINIKKEKLKEKVFEIKKEAKKPLLGRKRKNTLPKVNTGNDNDINYDKVHTKNKKDDMFTKLKRNAYNNSLHSFNYNLSQSKNIKINKIKLKKIDNSVIIVSKKEENQDLFKTQLKDLFSNKISKKYNDKYYKADYNEKMIKYILQQNDSKINSLLKKTFADMIEIYVDKNKEIIDGFTKLKDDKKFLEKNNDKDYIRLFTEFCYNYEENIDKIYPRRKRKKQNDGKSLN